VGGLTRYYPYGGYRGAPGSDLTDRGYTGHRENMDLGLIYMNARYYVAELGRFLSADTIVPDPGNPQSFSRYSYAYNSPLNHTDPSGHRPCGEDCSTAEPQLSKVERVVNAVCKKQGCIGENIGWVEIDLGFASSLTGKDRGIARLPYHKQPDYSRPESLFSWEGVADVTYAGHGSLHPARYQPGSPESVHFTEHFLGEATGIIQTMLNRAEEGSYRSANHAALTQGQYASPARDSADSVYQDVYSLSFMVVELNVRVDQPYQYFAHQDLYPNVRGTSPTGNLNDVRHTDTAAFGATWGPKTWYIPQTYPYR
jgi:RHS repeat-associated protein